MPIIKSAKKKLRQDKKRIKENLIYKEEYKKAIKKMYQKKEKEFLKKVFSKIDKAAKKGVIHKNKANRLKSRISKLFAKK
ncbi:MAG: 30S ribosomal protein S20 [Microgenomates group bacterium]|nr:30S ribosomal protein S20 [Microgenomates group bacterium]